MVTEADASRFWAKVNIEALGDCWLWTACSHHQTGYGMFQFKDKMCQAHRVSWHLIKGPVPPGVLVLHTCSDRYPPESKLNRKCVNPAHLYLGTHQDNSNDMVKAGRQGIGSKNSNAKLIEDDVRKIREQYATGNWLQKDLAAEHGVNQSMISRIVLGNGWRHLS